MVLSKSKVSYRELVSLAVPIALGSLVTFSISLSDNMMIASLGNTATSAVYLGNQVATLLTMLLAGIEGTVLVFSNQLIGADSIEKARKVARVGIIAAELLAVVFFIFSTFLTSMTLGLLTDKAELINEGSGFLRLLGISFLFFAPTQAMSSALRCVKKAKISFYAALFALIVNISLNYILIFGKFGLVAIGILGAGIATLVARFVEFLIVFIYVFFYDKSFSLRLRKLFSFDIDALKAFFKIGAPIISAQLVWSINNFFASALIGRISGEGVVAGASVAIALYNLSYVVTNGVSGAVGISVGRLVGEDGNGAAEKVGLFSRNVQLVFLFLGILTAVFMQAIKLPFLSLWGVSDEARGWALGFINILSVFVIGTAYQSASLNGIIKSSGNVRFILKVEGFFVFCVIIPLSLLAFRLGATPLVIFAILKCDQPLKCPVAYFKLRKGFKRTKAIQILNDVPEKLK